MLSALRYHPQDVTMERNLSIQQRENVIINYLILVLESGTRIKK